MEEKQNKEEWEAAACCGVVTNRTGSPVNVILEQKHEEGEGMNYKISGRREFQAEEILSTYLEKQEHTWQFWERARRLGTRKLSKEKTNRKWVLIMWIPVSGLLDSEWDGKILVGFEHRWAWNTFVLIRPLWLLCEEFTSSVKGKSRETRWYKKLS